MLLGDRSFVERDRVADFQKTGVYVCDENEKQLPKESLKAFDGAVDEYFAAVEGPVQ